MATLPVTTVMWNVFEMSILKRLIPRQEKKTIDFDYGGKYLRSISSKIKKKKFSFSWHLKIDKKSVANVKEDQGE